MTFLTFWEYQPIYKTKFQSISREIKLFQNLKTQKVYVFRFVTRFTVFKKQKNSKYKNKSSICFLQFYVSRTNQFLWGQMINYGVKIHFAHRTFDNGRMKKNADNFVL